MKPLFIKKNGTVSKVSGIIMNLIPSYTMAEYNALTHKPLLWVRTDEEYAQIPSEDVSYGSGSVEDALDDMNTKMPFKTLSTNMVIKNITGLADNTAIETDAWIPNAGLYLINIFISPLNVQSANPQVIITVLKNGTYYDDYSIIAGSDHAPSQAISQLVGSGKNWNYPLFLGSLIVELNGTDSFAVRMLNFTGAAISAEYNTSNFGFRYYKIRDL